MRHFVFAAAIAGLAACSGQTPSIQSQAATAGCAVTNVGKLPIDLGSRREGLSRQALEATFGNLDGAAGLEWRYLEPCSIDVVTSWIESGSAQERRLRRNTAIGAARTASIQRCSDYLMLLTQTDRESNFILGGLSTVLGGLGAIFSPVATARALSGAAGISSGLRAEVNATFFYNQAIGQIRRAIETRINRRWDELDKDLRAKSYTDLPYALAYARIHDIHSQCEMGAGFAEISEALARPAYTNPESFDLARRVELEKLRAELERLQRERRGANRQPPAVPSQPQPTGPTQPQPG